MAPSSSETLVAASARIRENVKRQLAEEGRFEIFFVTFGCLFDNTLNPVSLIETDSDGLPDHKPFWDAFHQFLARHHDCSSDQAEATNASPQDDGAHITQKAASTISHWLSPAELAGILSGLSGPRALALEMRTQYVQQRVSDWMKAMRTSPLPSLFSNPDLWKTATPSPNPVDDVFRRLESHVRRTVLLSVLHRVKLYEQVNQVASDFPDLASCSTEALLDQIADEGGDRWDTVQEYYKSGETALRIVQNHVGLLVFLSVLLDPDWLYEDPECRTQYRLGCLMVSDLSADYQTKMAQDFNEAWASRFCIIGQGILKQLVRNIPWNPEGA